jgi:hypothetical protein
MPSKLEKTIGSMFSSYADVTLEGFIEFYEELFGKGSYDKLDANT